MMENIWGRLKEPQNISLYTGISTEEGSTDVTKSTIRQKVWEFMERNDIANFPRPVYNRIPNFKGASAAGDKVSTLPEFRDARTVKVNPDKPQEEVRFRVLDAGKTLIVPTPRLTQGLFNRLEAEPDCTKESLRKMSSRYGIDSLSKPIPMASRLKVDLVVVGSVAVDRLGRRIGKGEGFADLEYAMAASHHSAVTQETVVISTVHDVQVFDELPQCLFSAHDLPVDIIVTPTEVIRVSNRLQKPDHILWDILKREKFDQIGILKELQFREKKAGKCVKLADGFEDVGPTVQLNNVGGEANRLEANGVFNDLEGNMYPRKGQEGKFANRNQNRRRVEGSGNPRRQRGKRNKKNGEEEGFEQGETIEKPIGKEQQERARNKRPQYSRNQESIGIFVGRIPRTARVKELKEAIQERGLRTNNLVWKGVKGFAFLYFDKAHTNLSEEEICLQLKDLKLGESILNIEPDKRKDKNKENTENAREDEGMGEAEAEHMDVHVNTTENIDGIRKETSHKQLVNKVQSGKPGPNSLSDKKQEEDEVDLEEKVGSINGLKSSINIGTEGQTLIKLDPKCKEAENITSHTSLGVNSTVETKIDLDSASLTSIKANQTNSNAKDLPPSIKSKLGETEAASKETKEGLQQNVSKVQKNLNTLDATRVNTQKATVDSAKGDKAPTVINEREPKNVDENHVTKPGNEKENFNIKADDTSSPKPKNSPEKQPEIEKKPTKVSDDNLPKQAKIENLNVKVDTSAIKPKNSLEKHPEAEHPSKDGLNGDSKHVSASASSDKGIDSSKQVLKQEETKSSENQKGKKEEEKAASKTESGAAKKEKSKSPDKEVKKEEGSGGGFFKRFWK